MQDLVTLSMTCSSILKYMPLATIGLVFGSINFNGGWGWEVEERPYSSHVSFHVQCKVNFRQTISFMTVLQKPCLIPSIRVSHIGYYTLHKIPDD